MRTVTVQVQDDFLQRMVKTPKPLSAIEELIWNGLDADAQRVEVSFVRTELGAITEILVTDNGHGIEYDDAERAFGSLGGSWKQAGSRSKRQKRVLHGKAGKGRYRAFALGQAVRWDTSYSDNSHTSSYRIHGSLDKLVEFKLEDPRSDGRDTGTCVHITGLRRDYEALTQPAAIGEITESFALYLRNYPGVSIIYDGCQIEYSQAILNECTLDISDLALVAASKEKPTLTVIEWSFKTDRRILLCDRDGFVRNELPAGVSAHNLNFTAYLKSDLVDDCVEDNVVQLLELDPRLKMLLDAAKRTLRSYLRSKEAQQAENVIDEWKREGIYPYSGDPLGPLDMARREVFDICAASISDYLPDFDKVESKARKFQLRLLREALEDSPEDILAIVRDVLDLPQAKQAELADLLKKTSLTAVINAAKIVADRLDFLRGLEILVFTPELKKTVLERKHLHRIIADHTWVFGEEFNLTVDDQSLNEVLNKHLHLLGRDNNVDSPVLRDDGTEGIVDLMLSRRVPHPRAEKREHLVIELKRPKQKIDQTVLSQLESYSFAVESDERFRDTDTRWLFWAVSNELAEPVQRKAHQKDRPLGQVYESDNGRLTIWVRTWGQIIEDCRSRLQFYEEQLQYQPDYDSALKYLRERHPGHLPTSCLDDQQDSSKEELINVLEAT